MCFHAQLCNKVVNEVWYEIMSIQCITTWFVISILIMINHLNSSLYFKCSILLINFIIDMNFSSNSTYFSSLINIVFIKIKLDRRCLLQIKLQCSLLVCLVFRHWPQPYSFSSTSSSLGNTSWQSLDYHG